MIYTSTNKIKFTSISERYQVPKQFKGQLSALHGKLITYVADHFTNTKKYKQKVVDALNILTYSVLEHEVPPFNWSTESPLATMPDVDMDRIQNTLGLIFLTVDAIEWDVVPSSAPVESAEASVASTVSTVIPASVTASANSSAFSDKQVRPLPVQKRVSFSDMKKAVAETQKEDLYIKSPTYPQFDYNRPWLSRQDGVDKLVIYTTLPEIPTKQNEISITTNVNNMSESELMALYPTKLIRTRSPILYDMVPGLDYDTDLGVIFPIVGYTSDQLVDNIIRFPHLYKLQRVVDDEVRSFYNDIEIDGELISISDAWDKLPESLSIPRQSEFIKEYIVRRYLLEEESGITHKYKMYGTLDPFLTLFMPVEKYIERGYTDTTEIVKQCVRSRVAFKQSRNPILRRLNLVNTN